MNRNPEISLVPPLDPDPPPPGDDDAPYDPDDADGATMRGGPSATIAAADDSLGDRRTLAGLATNAKGAPLSTLDNIVRVLSTHPLWNGGQIPDRRLRWSEWEGAVIWQRPPPFSALLSSSRDIVAKLESPDPAASDEETPGVDDDDATRLCVWLSQAYGMNVTQGMTYSAMRVVAKASPHINPVREYLVDASSRWDELPRVDTWLTRYLGVPDTPYTRAVGRWWLLSGVARVVRPGCQADHVLVLEGAQGAGKSTALRILFSERFYTGSPIDVTTKEGPMVTRRKWGVELAEFSVADRATVAALKGFLTTATDDYREPYQRHPISVARRCIFAVTINPSGCYLTDPTGARRFWPVTCGRIDRDALARDRDMLWGEAVLRYEIGDRWYPTTDAERGLCQAEQEHRTATDAWLDPIRSWLETQARSPVFCGMVTLAEVLTDGLSIPLERHPMSYTRAGRVLAELGWKRRRMPARLGLDSPRGWGYAPPDA